MLMICSCKLTFSVEKLWKEKCELWQMNDGSIVHAVKWDVEDGYRHTIPSLQIKYLLETHLGVSNSSVHCVVDQVDPILFALHDKTKSLETPKAANLFLDRAYDELEEIFLELSGIPLRIAEIHRAHSALSFTAATVPTPHPLLVQSERVTAAPHSFSRYAEPIQIYLELEESSQWPNDIEAIEALKASFYVLLSRELNKQRRIETTVTKQFVDVFWRGFAFRTAIRLPQEISATEEFVSIQQGKDLQREQVEKATHLNAIRGLHAFYSVYGTTTRLAKFWIHSQMLSG